MEILKYGADVEVLAPASLRERVVHALQAAAARY
jgi:predicted DNA-binding transcriptional regulator YafY